ncbi:MAG: two-component system, chemotaxis family, sensor kinase CheA [Actinomycetota bacterium]|nr:two-component system, chemotaxis family, sensor kinase CheA [Actinomycetota bacterium]
MSILDLESFRVLFAQEAEGRLATLGQLALELEAAGNDEGIIAAIFREVHTLKGSAAVVGFGEVSGCAHRLEQRLEALRSGASPVSSELVDALLQALDELSALTAQAVGGEVAEVGLKPLTIPTVSLPSPAAPAVRPPAGTHDAGVVMVPLERLDELIRLVGESAAAHLRVGRLLWERLGLEPAGIPEFSELSRTLNDLQERTMRTRMVPVATMTDQLHRAVRDLARTLGREVAWEVRGGDTELDRGVLRQLSDSLLHLVRNAVDHGVEIPEERVAAGKPPQGNILLHAMQLGSEVVIAVTDDGRGIDVSRVRSQAERQGIETAGLSDEEALQLVFRSGLSTAHFVSDVSGRGVGLDVVEASVGAARGRIEVRSVAGKGTEFRLIVPISLAVLPCLVVAAGDQHFALPMHSVILARADHAGDTAHAEERSAVWIGGMPVVVSSLVGTLGMPSTPPAGPVVILESGARRYGFQVDALVGQRDVVVKDLGQLLPRLGVVQGAGVDPDGAVLVVLDASGLIERAWQSGPAPADSPPTSAVREPPPASGVILVVDDALTVRELQRSILERAGYRVRLASDGTEALAALIGEPVDLVLTDVEMPRLDGFGLTEAIRSHPAMANTAVLILSSRASDEDRVRGMEAGADGYIIKSAFDERGLLTAVEQLLGSRG